MLKFWCVSFRDNATYIFSITRPRLDVQNSKVRRNTFGNAVWSRERGVSGPKKITVGCVILIVPRRKRVSHAVVADTAKARAESVRAMGSVIVSLQALSIDEVVIRPPLLVRARIARSSLGRHPTNS